MTEEVQHMGGSVICKVAWCWPFLLSLLNLVAAVHT